jgi:hypothetical protein
MEARILTNLFFAVFFNITSAQNVDIHEIQSPITIELVKPNFITMLNTNHKSNRIGYRFHEHHPIAFGCIPLSNREAGIDTGKISQSENLFKSCDDIFIYEHAIAGYESWTKQKWTYYMAPVHDGIEILLIVETFNEGLPEYYGIQQCFRLGGKTNQEWRREIANAPAFSEYDLWTSDSLQFGSTSLTLIQRNNSWQEIPASHETLGVRTRLGITFDSIRMADNPLPAFVGPYEARMLSPADCLHSVVNIGDIPPYSKRMIRGKIYWFEGKPKDLLQHYYNDFGNK